MTLLVNPLLLGVGFYVVLSTKKKTDSVFIHEAGHAVVTHALGKEFTHIRINTCGVRGEVEGVAVENPTVEDHLDTIRIYMAGTIACELFIGGNLNRFADEGFHDNLEISRLLYSNPELLAGKSKEQFLYTLNYETTKLLLANTDKVRKLADILETKNILTYDESQYILA